MRKIAKMEFTSLFKKYAMTNSSECEKDYKDRFDSELSIHIPMMINGYEAFFYGHPSLYLKIVKIYKLNGDVNLIFNRLSPVARKHYTKACLINEIQLTNEIEGVVSTRKEISEIISAFNKRKKATKRLEGIVNSYIKFFLDKNELQLNSAIDVRKIYDELLFEEISKENPDNLPDGELFRQNNVEVDNIQGDVVHKGVFPENKIITYLNEAISILKNNEIEPIIRICIFHYMFGYIHPFYDGNGRTDRFITSYFLSKEISPVVAYSISCSIKEKVGVYYKAFKDTNDPRNYGDIATFVNTMLDFIIDAEEKTIEYGEMKIKELNISMEKLQQMNLTKKELDFMYVLLQASIFSDSGVTIKELVGITNFDHKTIRIYLNRYSDFIVQKSKQREFSFSLEIEKLLN